MVAKIGHHGRKTDMKHHEISQRKLVGRWNIDTDWTLVRLSARLLIVWSLANERSFILAFRLDWVPTYIHRQIGPLGLGPNVRHSMLKSTNARIMYYLVNED